MFAKKPSQPEPASVPSLSPRRTELAALIATTIGLTQRQTELATPNSRYETIIREESEARVAFNGVGALEAQDAAAWVAQGGDRPLPRTEERQRAQAALAAASAAADGARRADQERQSELAAVNGTISALMVDRRRLIAEIIRFDVVPGLLRRYAEAAVTVNREYIALRSVAELLSSEFVGLVPGLFNNVVQQPQAVQIPQPDATGEIEPLEVSVTEMTAAANATVRQFVSALITDATAEWTP